MRDVRTYYCLHASKRMGRSAAVAALGFVYDGLLDGSLNFRGREVRYAMMAPFCLSWKRETFPRV